MITTDLCASALLLGLKMRIYTASRARSFTALSLGIVLLFQSDAVARADGQLLGAHPVGMENTVL